MGKATKFLVTVFASVAYLLITNPRLVSILWQGRQSLSKTVQIPCLY